MYFQPWWLDALCGAECWGASVATDRGGTVTGILPYHIRRRWGLPFLQMPPLTPYAGPLFFYPSHTDFKTHSRYAFEKKVSETLIAQLPRCVLFRQHFRPEVTNWLPFQQARFRQTTRYTFVVETARRSLADIEQAMKSSVRNHLKNAAGVVYVAEAADGLEALFESFCARLRAKRLPPPCSVPVFLRLHQAADARGHIYSLVARHRDTHIVQAGVYLVVEPGRVGVLWSVVTTEGRHTGALLLLLWKAIELAWRTGAVLDLEGSMDPGVEHLYRSLGGNMVPCFRVWRRGWYS